MNGRPEVVFYCDAPTRKENLVSNVTLAYTEGSYETQLSEVRKSIGQTIPEKLRKLRKKSSTELIVDYPLICFKQDDSPGTLFISNADNNPENQRIISLQLPGEILIIEQMMIH